MHPVHRFFIPVGAGDFLFVVAHSALVRHTSVLELCFFTMVLLGTTYFGRDLGPEVSAELAAAAAAVLRLIPDSGEEGFEPEPLSCVPSSTTLFEIVLGILKVFQTNFVIKK